MFNIFKKKLVEIYNLYNYWDKEGRIPVVRDVPNKLGKIYVKKYKEDINKSIVNLYSLG